VVSRLDEHTILLVEDEPFILMEVQRVLETAGARVLPAYTVAEALDALPTGSVTAAILDFKLHDGTADDLCRELVSRNIPFVIYSGYPRVEGECTRWAIVSKPADPVLLVSSVLDVLTAQGCVKPQ
jgi:CheY-like chemotaxis protein